jgi:hypothetical protein
VRSSADSVGEWLHRADVDDGLVTNSLANGSYVIEQHLSRHVLIDLTIPDSIALPGREQAHATPECWKRLGGECPCSQELMPQNWPPIGRRLERATLVPS